MSDSMIHSVCEFNNIVLGIKDRPLEPWKRDEYKFLTHALQEEIDELDIAYVGEDIVGITDALLDLCYFAIGGLYRAGLTPDQIQACFHVIHSANMRKKLGVNGKRDYGVEDANKPDDWVSPEEEIANIILL